MKKEKLKLHIHQLRGLTYKPNQISDELKEDFIPILKANNIKEDGLDISNLIYIHKDLVKETQIIKKGDTLIAASSGSIKVIGKNAYFDLEDDFTFGAFCKVARPKPTVFPEYLKHFFKTSYYKRTIISQVQGANINNLKTRDLDDLIISIPNDFNDQKRIAQVLSNCESLIQKRKESIALLDELLKSTFLEMFSKRVGEEVFLGEEIDIQNGLVNPNELPYSEMFHVGGRNIKSNTGKISNLIKAKDENLISGKYLFEEGYLLYSKIRPNLNKVAVMGFTGICSADVYPIKPKKTNRLNLHFLRYELMSKKFVTYAVNNSGRANIPKINRKTLNAYKLKLPSIEKQNKFAEIVKKTEVIRNHFYTHLQELENLYGSISQKAFKGELDLNKVNILETRVFSDNPKETPDDFMVYAKKKLDDIEYKKVSKKDVFEHITNPKKKRDITDLSLADYYEIPIDIQASRENIEFDFISDDLFYQFLLKDTFKKEPFTSVDIFDKLNNYFYNIGNIDYDNEVWKDILFKFMEAKPPLLKQFFDENDNTVKLKLTDEAFKA